MFGRILIFVGGAMAGYLFREEIGQGLDRLQDAWDKCTAEEADERNADGSEEPVAPVEGKEVTAHSS
jgi:hypothetical protein